MVFPTEKISVSCFKQAAILLGMLFGVSLSGIAQPKISQVTMTVPANGPLQVKVRSIESTNSWSFRNSVAGTLGLADRITDFAGDSGKTTRVASGVFACDTAVSNYSYSVDLSHPEVANVSHASWLTTSEGILMLADLLPQNLIASSTGLSISFELPADWTISPSLKDRQYLVQTSATAVFLVSKSVRKETKKASGTTIDLFVSGTWPFSNSKVVSLASRILTNYSEVTRYRLRQQPTIIVAPLPIHSSLTQWKAETRGSSIVLLIDPSARFANWVGQLGVILTHETFHLWVPNSLSLEGDYDWFFEGFSLYQGLLTAVELKLINFDEYLATMARVYDSFLSYAQPVSLIDASEQRWTSNGSYVYDKGMLVAFMYDLLTRSQAGRRVIADVYTKLFASYADKPANGNDVIISLLSSSPETREFCKQYVEGKTNPDLESFASKYGFQVDTTGSHTRITIKDNLTSFQRDLLRSLGYNKKK